MNDPTLSASEQLDQAKLWLQPVEDSVRDALPWCQDPLRQRLAASACLKLRPRVEERDGNAILTAVAQCAMYGLVMPGWLASAYLDAYQAVTTGHARSWADPKSFGAAYAPGKNIKGVYMRESLAPDMYQAALLKIAEAPEVGLDKAFYEGLAEDLVGVAGIEVGATNLEQVLREYVVRSDGIWPSLVEFKDLCAPGDGIDAALDRWTEGRKRLQWREVVGSDEGFDEYWRGPSESP